MVFAIEAIKILQVRQQREHLFAIVLDLRHIAVEQIEIFQALELFLQLQSPRTYEQRSQPHKRNTYQWLQSFQILDLVAAQIEVSQLVAAVQQVESARYSIVAELQLGQIGQLREALQAGQTDVDQA